MAGEVPIVEPKTDSIEVKAKLSGSLGDIQKRLGDLQIFSITSSKDSVKLLKIESRDLQKKPFLFIIIDMGASRLAAEYTIAPDTSPKLRRLAVIKTLLGVLSLVSDLYTVDNTEFFQYVDSAIDDVTNSITQSYSTLFNSYDSLFNEYRELKRQNIELTASNKNLTVQALQLSDQNKSMDAELKELRGYSDNSLMVMIQEWIDSHDSTIDINEFAKNYKMTPTRVEQMLNRMVSLGYIELKG